MNKKEVVKIFALLSAAYPKFESLNILKSPELAETTIELWYKMLGDVDYQVIELAIQKHVLSSPFPPSIADIRKSAIEVMTPVNEKLDAATAWGEVEAAIRKFGSWGESEALESMSPRTARVVRYLNWQEICLSDKLGVIRGQFINMYGQVEQRENKDRLLPAKLRNEIESIAAGFSLKLVEGDQRGAALNESRE